MATINPFQGPANYAVEVQSPFESALGGFKLGAGMAEVQAAQQKRELELKALQQAQQRQVELADLFKNPNATSADYARVTSFLPEKQAEIVLKNFETQTKERQQQTLRQGAQVYSAIKSGNLDVAEMQLKEQAAALRNSGNEQQAQAFDDVSNLIRLNPTGAQATIGLLVAALPGGKDFLDNADKALGTIRTEAEAPSKLTSSITEAQTKVADLRIKLQNEPIEAERLVIKRDLEVAEAKIADIEAKYAEQKIKLGLRKTEEDIIINRENARIAALNAQIARETNALKKDELTLKLSEAIDKRDQATRDQKANLASQSADIDNFLNTAAQILKVPDEVIKQASGPITARLPTLSQNVSDLESLVETAGSQIFLAVIPKMKSLGALSEAEGNKLQTSLTNLSLKQSPEQFKANMKEAVRLMEKGRVNLELRSGMTAPPMDVPERPVIVQTPSGPVTLPNRASANAFKAKWGLQ
jgi:hypothetical protein